MFARTECPISHCELTVNQRTPLTPVAYNFHFQTCWQSLAVHSQWKWKLWLVTLNRQCQQSLYYRFRLDWSIGPNKITPVTCSAVVPDTSIVHSTSTRFSQGFLLQGFPLESVDVQDRSQWCRNPYIYFPIYFFIQHNSWHIMIKVASSLFPTMKYGVAIHYVSIAINAISRGLRMYRCIYKYITKDTWGQVGTASTWPESEFGPLIFFLSLAK